MMIQFLALASGFFILNPTALRDWQAAGDEPTTVVLESGEQLERRLAGISQGEIRFSDSTDPLPISQISKLKFSRTARNPSTPPFAEIMGRGGTRLQVSGVKLDGEVLKVQLDQRGPEVQLPREKLVALRFRRDLAPERWQAVADKARDSDGLIVAREDRLDVISGIIQELDETQVRFETRGRAATVELSKLAGLLFFQADADTSAPNLTVTDVFGNRYAGSAVGLVDGLLDVQAGSEDAPKGNSIRIPLDLVAEIDFSSGKIIELQSLDPQSRSWTPFAQADVSDKEVRELLQQAREQKVVWTKNHCFGQPLTLELRGERTATNPAGRRVFNTGLAILGGTQLVFEIPPDAKSFQAFAGIQANRRSSGTVELEIFVDGKPVHQKRLTGTDEQAHWIDIPVPGDRLTISVGYAGDDQQGDILVLGNPRFKKTP